MDVLSTWVGPAQLCSAAPSAKSFWRWGLPNQSGRGHPVLNTSMPRATSSRKKHQKIITTGKNGRKSSIISFRRFFGSFELRVGGLEVRATFP